MMIRIFKNSVIIFSIFTITNVLTRQDHQHHSGKHGGGNANGGGGSGGMSERERDDKDLSLWINEQQVKMFSGN